MEPNILDITVFLVRAFGVNEKGGNPAGVVLDAASLTVLQKMEISKRIGYSETAFVEPSNVADYKVTFYTPTDEVDLCGHATIATYSYLFKEGLIRPGTYKQEIKAGVLEIEISVDGSVIMEQTLPEFSDLISIQDILQIFNISPDSFELSQLSPQIISTGLKDIMLPVKDLNTLFSLKPDFKKMSEFNQKTNTVGFHAFTLDTLDPKSTAHCRNFAPLYGIDEESATGSSNGALACYLFNYGKLGNKPLAHLIFEQGYSMDQPSEIMASLTVENDKITKVKVGGKGILFGKQVISLS